ncbi:DUF3822 family protein [Jejudonia soesokkakensis]|uniref:DUF3822 family protein n=1 Tax=Jejudonia soesokkakensis TaxID=1323432 RepID=A0ABW2MTY5_9FLAO
MTPKKKNNTIHHTNQSLSVHVSLTGLSFLITSEATSETLHFSEINFITPATPEELLLEIEKALTSKEDLQTNFENINVVYATDLYTIVPESLFDENKASEYLKFNAKILANDFIASDVVKDHPMVVVYVPFININNFFFDRFGSFTYYHAVTILLEKILHSEEQGINPKMYINVNKEHVDCIIVDGNSLQLCNTYNFKTPEDFIYYILFAFEQLKLNPETTQTIVMGAINFEDDTYAMLYTYIRHISLFEDATGISIDSEANHQHIILKSLASCE